MDDRGWWLAVTRSGARHLIDATNLNHVTVTRLPACTDPPSAGFRLVGLRRDVQPIHTRDIRRLHEGHPAPGAQVGDDMLLRLEPLAQQMVATIRRTTPVVSIELVQWEEASDE
ncbi:MAG: hypothetical protein HGA44_06350 [Cellulomonadaceae bacterium]|nr:hypothetical protein [Cellulomonadaceae bacterium]